MATADKEEGRTPGRDRGVAELGEDTTGFGRLELRTVRDALLRPAAMLEAYMTAGPSGGGVYTRPLRLYLALCGILMLMLFLMGGISVMLAGLPAETLNPLIERSGKSREAFIGDADNWMSLVLVPINALFYALFSAPLLRWWDDAHLGWRKAFRATFHYLNVWTIPLVPIGWLAYRPETANVASLIMVLLSFIAFLRAGRGRWYRSWPIGMVKAVAITLASVLAAFAATFPVVAIALAGGVFG